MNSEIAAENSASANPSTTKTRDLSRISRDLLGDLFSGTVIATSNIALAVSFAAVIFQGELAGGFTTGVWAMLMSMVVVGVIVGFLTSLQPIAGGPDTAVIAVMSLFATAIMARLASIGVSNADLVIHVMLGMTLMTVLAGSTVLMLGVMRWGQLLRFVPYPLIAGFLAATGLLLIASSPRIITDGTFQIEQISVLWANENQAKLGIMLAFAILLAAGRTIFESPLVVPVVFFSMAAALNAVLRTGQLGEEASWYVSSTHGLEPWLPVDAIQNSEIHWSVYLSSLPELATCVIVGLISLIVRISSLEASRLAAANINHELRIYGGASLLAGIGGAMTGGILFSTSKFMVASGARTRFAYVVIAALLGLTMFANIDLASIVPTPILGGLLLLLGCSMTFEALRVTFRQRAVKEIVLAIAIMLLCLKFGFIVGVLAGFVAACLMFAYSYARIGVVRRYSTRAELAGGTERSHDAELLIRNNGESIQVYELAGYVFFGSSESLFEQIRTVARKQDNPAVRIVILDFARVTGYDSSAVNTLNKLRGYCRRHDISLCLSALDRNFLENYALTEMPGLTGDARFFDGLIEALDWSEECLLAALQQPRPKAASTADFAKWLSKELGTEIAAEMASLYFDRIDVDAGEQLYTQGEAADTIDFVASGTVAMMSHSESEDRRTCVRRSSRQTVLGEMGFFRGAKRNVSIVAERPTTIFSLSRANFEKLKVSNPEIHYGLLNFVIRTLADRLEMATTELSSIR